MQMCGEKGVCRLKELCGDGLDNDLNGQIDEGCPARHCLASSDCKATELCSAGSCVPRCNTEICGDNVDNDCDGQIDESCKPVCKKGDTRPCYSGEQKYRGVGRCREGKQACLSYGQWGDCRDSVLPVAELCHNKLDDDCDGQLDEKDCVPGSCKSKDDCPENRECKNGLCARICTREICKDRKDNDCDGQIDEKYCFPVKCDASNPCPPLFECSQSQCKRVCKKERCHDGWDNDCDGKVDEGCPPKACIPGQKKTCFSGPPKAVFTGSCKPGVQTCVDFLWSTCKGEVLPSAERCGDRKDNDCDGLVDENCTSSGCVADKDCKQGQGCLEQRCVWKTTSCQSDRDCSEGFVCHQKQCVHSDCKDNARLHCDASVCKQGERRCLRGKWSVCVEKGPKVEYCDGKDNDCDGKIDVHCVMLCRSHRHCLAGWHCVKQRCQRHCYQEVCDGDDNDCDGKVDEGCLGKPCFVDRECMKGMFCRSSKCSFW